MEDDQTRICMLVDFFGDLIKPHLGEYHLDYGCGNGWITYYAADKCPEKRFIGYDIDYKKIGFAKEKFKRDNLSFISSKENLLKLSPFRSISSAFVFHNIPTDMFKDWKYLLLSNGRVCVLDYNLKGKSLEEFKKTFITKKEKKIIEDLGLEQAFNVYTSVGLEDCIGLGESNGFETVKAHKILNKYFLWIGKK